MTEPKPILGAPGYLCDSAGSIYSLKSGEIRRMNPRVSSRGYLALTLSQAGAPTTHLVHRLILQTWTGLPGDGLEVNHKNGLKTDNRVENLEWSTRTENERHARRELGKNCQGEKHKCAKLTADQVREIRQRRADGWTYPRLAQYYGVGMSQLHRIVKRTKWAHV